ncbi:SRPBCC family protein [Iningainema tapete]|uniref:SRPBCC domain-containing protein n=1 Tax=Iningainema tapete BLCC-T55 TaxID=2748662 RepID=A0A8J6XG54_9CYAN|nr:SRPBCC domain-containing protein [Iningainema tapete]MBD2775224.1 SRPBCC domain-containing protein [Iningainema tapete BLCC-T55]
MLGNLKIETFYPHPPQRIWQVLTNSRTLAAWLMENDFEPRLGHKFQFQHTTLPGLDVRIDCEVIEIDAPKRLSYTWQDKFMCQPSIVTWTLEAVDNGTKLQLLHQAVKTLHVTSLHKSMRYAQPWQNQFVQTPTAVTQTPLLQSMPVGRYEALDSVILNSFLNGGWDYKLNERMPQILILIQ